MKTCIMLFLFCTTLMINGQEVKLEYLFEINKKETLRHPYQGPILYTQNEKYGIANFDGNVIVNPKYDRLDFIGKDTFLFQDSANFGLINQNEQVILRYECDSLRRIPHPFGYLAIKKDGLWSIVTIDQKQYSNQKYTSFLEARKVLSEDYRFLKNHTIIGIDTFKIINTVGACCAVVEKGGMYGVLIDSLREIINPVYNAVSRIKRDMPVFVGQTNTGKVLINRHGKMLSKYDDYAYGGDGLIKVRKNDKWGIIDTNYNSIISPQYHDIKKLKNGFFLYGKETKIDGEPRIRKFALTKELREVENYEFDLIQQENQKMGLANTTTIEPNDEYTHVYYILKKTGEIIYGPIIDTNYPIDGLDINISYDNFFKINDQAFDTTGHALLPNLNIISSHSKGYKIEARNGKKGFVNFKGKIIIDTLYDDISFRHDFFQVQIENKNGICNARGKLVIPAVYDKIVKEIQDNYFIYWIDNKYGLIDSTGSIIMTEIEKSKNIHKVNLIIINNNQVFVYKKGSSRPYDTRIYQIDESRFVDFPVHEYQYLIPGILAVYNGAKWGIANIKGELVTSFKFDYIESCERNYGEDGECYTFVKESDRKGLLKITVDSRND